MYFQVLILHILSTQVCGTGPKVLWFFMSILILSSAEKSIGNHILLF